MTLASASMTGTLTKLEGLRFMWLEITEKCNLECSHCYVESSPQKPLYSSMTDEDWLRVMDEAAKLGCKGIQFIGGEPTMHPALERFIEHAHYLHFETIEVYTNATRLSPRVLAFMREHGVRIATSFYACDPLIHEKITRRKGSFKQTVDSIKSILDFGLPLRVGLIEMEENRDRIPETMEFLRSLGVLDIGTDIARGFGRAKESSIQGLCGSCWNGNLCVSTNGDCFPCIMSRDFIVGSVLAENLESIVQGRRTQMFREKIYNEVWLPSLPQDERMSSVMNGPCTPNRGETRKTCGPDSPWCTPNRGGTRKGCGPDSPWCHPKREC